MVIQLGGSVRALVARHCEAAYPQEACGALLGKELGATAHVTSIEPLPNLAADPRRTFRLDPLDVRRLLVAEHQGGARLLGFYHSHPDAPAAPSEDDLRLAWPTYRYLTVSVQAGKVREARAWTVTGAGPSPRTHLRPRRG